MSNGSILGVGMICGMLCFFFMLLMKLKPALDMVTMNLK